MSTSTLGLFLRHLALNEEVNRLGTNNDHTLLAAYESGNGQDTLSQAAFTELMRRHGPMVLRTCRRVLKRETDAEDAFQATFIFLARQAGSISKRETLGGWLHRVAFHNAVSVLRRATRRMTHERQASARTYVEPDPVTRASWNEIWPILDAELDALPDDARRLLIACYLQDKTHAEAAAELGLPPGSLARHLERARTLLAKRLARRGITVSALLLAILLEDSAKGAGVPAVLLVHTVEAARTFTEQANAMVSDNVARLVKGGLAQMTKGWTPVSLALVGCVSLLGAGLIACQTLKVWPEQLPDSELPATPALEPSAQEGNKQTHRDHHGDPLPPGALARLGTMRLRHNGGIGSLAFTPDGKGLLTAGGDNFPRLWEVPTGKLIREFTSIPKPYQKLIHLQNGNLGIGFEYHGVGHAVLSPDGRFLATRSGRMNSLYLLETATGKLLYEFKREFKGTPERVWSGLNVAFSPDGKLMAAQFDSRLELREMVTGRTLWKKGKQAGANPRENYIVSGLAFSPDGKVLASGKHGNGEVHLWDARTGELLRALDVKPTVNRVVFSPDGRTLAVGHDRAGYGQNVQLWDVDTGKKVRQLGESHKRTTFPLFSPDGKIVATCGEKGFCLWETATGKELRRCQNSILCGDEVYVIPVAAFSPDGKVLAAIDGPLVRFWEVASGKALPSPLPTGHESSVNSVALTPDGQTLVSAGVDKTVRWWDTRTGQERLNLQCMKFPLIYQKIFQGDQPKAVLSPDGTVLAIICWDVPEGELIRWGELDKTRGGSIRLWDAATGKELHRLDSGKGKAVPVTVAFSPDGKWLAEGFWDLSEDSWSTRLWEVATGKRREHKFDGAMPVFSRNGTILATGERSPGQVIRLWEVATGKKIHSIHRKEGIACLALSPDGKALATGSDETGRDGGIFLYPLYWDKSSEMRVGTPRLLDYRWSVFDLAFSPDGKTLACRGNYPLIYLWETASGKERAHFQQHSTGAGYFQQYGITRATNLTGGASLSFTADGRRFASANPDGTILLWDVTGRLQDGRLRPAQLSDRELEKLWADLAADDARRAGRAIWTLAAAPDQSVPYLRQRSRTIAQEGRAQVPQLLRDLDDDTFTVRNKAQKELEKLGVVAEPALRQALSKKGLSVEMRRSLVQLLQALEAPSGGESLRGVRAREVLEHIGTREAREALKNLAAAAGTE
jgi:RNA polymerase sigma factor (sigma-70 family)